VEITARNRVTEVLVVRVQDKIAHLCKEWLGGFSPSCTFLTHGLTPPSFTFTPRLSSSSFRSALKSKSIVFIGDSVTRYQYLNLSFFLERGKWPHPFVTDDIRKGNPCCEKSFQNLSWSFFYSETNAALSFVIITNAALSFVIVGEKKF
jgi:hypothetical protein